MSRRVFRDRSARSLGSPEGVDVDEVLDWPGAPAMFTFRDVDQNILYIVEDD